MKLKKEDTITSFQFIFLIIQAQVGVGILSMPFSIYTEAGHDGWISVLIGGCVVQVLLILFWILMKRFPSMTLYEILDTTTGIFIGSIIKGLYFIYFVLVGSSILSLFAEMINIWILPLTPRWLLIVLMAGIGIYAVRGPVKFLARFYVFVSFMLIIFVLLVIYSFFEVDYLNILPIGQKGIMPIINGTEKALFSMLGFEMYFIVAPYVNSTSIKKLKSASISNAVVTIFYSFLTLICILFFGLNEFKLVPEPLLYMIKSFSFKVLERIDLLFLSLWIVSVATSYMAYLFAASRGLMSYSKKNKEHTPFVLYAAIPSVLISLIPEGVYKIGEFTTFVTYLSYIFVFGLPVMLLLLSLLTHRKEKQQS
ncbi:GerAB/ArcD/ProY family transporter [Fictibacillus fluitans]|uniref:GerAB/ArcD/ProY family transporter n=1 Tax=Fictibacillus fluitans TaxID=3058422 RepID=A0ABT8HY19_9BACL|nr:GerAB/ArcD/ProY family transporter [Fictibacillus sp. NE201]MDN4525674.1 GerAB/ArcD/ProY family transporter [Fictibacillus sp. NE201]